MTSASPHAFGAGMTSASPHAFGAGMTSASPHAFDDGMTSASPHAFGAGLTSASPHAFGVGMTSASPHAFSAGMTSASPHAFDGGMTLANNGFLAATQPRTPAENSRWQTVLDASCTPCSPSICARSSGLARRRFPELFRIRVRSCRGVVDFDQPILGLSATEPMWRYLWTSGNSTETVALFWQHPWMFAVNWWKCKQVAGKRTESLLGL